MVKNLFLFMGVVLIELIVLSAFGSTASLEESAGLHRTDKDGISASPQKTGSGEYQISLPKTLQAGEKGIIKLIIVPDTLPAEKIRFGKFDEFTTQSLQGTIDIYPCLNTEIATGAFFSVTPESIDLRVDVNQVTTWQWDITALTAGIHKLSVNISIPAGLNGAKDMQVIAHGEFEINVLSPTATPIPPMPTPIPPTPASTPLESKNLSDSTQNIMENVVAGIVLAGLGLLGTQVYFHLIEKRKK